MIYLLPHTIDRAIDRNAECEAFRCQGKAITFGQLFAESNRLAHWLVDQGVQRGDRVGVYMPQCLESAVAVYGIMRAGAAYVPIDPLAPLTSVQRIVHQCGINVLATHASQQSSVDKLCRGETDLQTIIGAQVNGKQAPRAVPWNALKELPDNRPPSICVLGHDLAYIMCTSGSTGQPKGIMHTHASGLTYAALSVQTYDVKRGDRIGNHSPLHFDMSTFGYFSGPYAAATTVLIPASYTKLPASLSQLMETEQLTIWYSVPFALIQLLLRGVLDQRDLSRLRWVLFGGEPFPPKHLRALMRQWPAARFSNVYGPAEVNQCTYYHVPPPLSGGGSSTDEEPIPIGKTWDNTEGLIVDSSDCPVAPGEPGELLIRSATMMQGYWAQRELNSVAFYRPAVYDKSLADNDYHKVYYRTGDLVQERSDGNIVFLGRKDRQIKVRGHRIELDEIELSLASHPDVEEAAVYPVHRTDALTEIEAAVILKAGATTAAADFGPFLSHRIPAYALPAKFKVAESLPRTASNKIDRRKLQELAELELNQTMIK